MSEQSKIKYLQAEPLYLLNGWAVRTMAGLNTGPGSLDGAALTEEEADGSRFAFAFNLHHDLVEGKPQLTTEDIQSILTHYNTALENLAESVPMHGESEFTMPKLSVLAVYGQDDCRSYNPLGELQHVRKNPLPLNKGFIWYATEFTSGPISTAEDVYAKMWGSTDFLEGWSIEPEPVKGSADGYIAFTETVEGKTYEEGVFFNLTRVSEDGIDADALGLALAEHIESVFDNLDPYRLRFMVTRISLYCGEERAIVNIWRKK